MAKSAHSGRDESSADSRTRGREPAARRRFPQSAIARRRNCHRRPACAIVSSKWGGGETAMSEAAARDPSDAEAIARGKHIVDILIEERAKTLIRSRFWPLYRAILYPLLKEPKARHMADAIAELPGRDAMAHVSRTLSLDVKASGLEHVPAQGRVIVASVHPTGIADGVAMYDALKEKRPDLAFFANRDAIRVAPRLAEVVIPVEWVVEKRTRQRSRETLLEAKKAFTDDRCVILFPSGRLAYMGDDKKLIEREWLTSVAIFARKYDCAIVPAHIAARNSWLYYWFWKLNTELRDITLFNELLNKRGKRFDIRFGQAIPSEELDGDPVEVTKALRDHAAYGVPAGGRWTPLELRGRSR
ncbi:MAG: 1-acyl-sn-glycerol-3-phosphate acyltransferase [Pseudomonadota bacterium]